MNIVYRKAEFSDHTEIARLHADSWKRNYRGILSEQYLEHEVEKDRLETWQKRLGAPALNQHVTVATESNRVIAFCCILLDDDPVFGSLIDNLHVMTGLQKSGIGKMLISHSAAIMRDKASSKNVYLWVYENNTNARAAYDRLGAINVETLAKKHDDGSVARACRYAWADASQLIIRQPV